MLDAPGGATTPYNVTDYFLKNSYGKPHITGDVAYATLNHNESYYNNADPNRVRAAITTEALKEVDSTVDFAEYDNWSNPNGVWTYSPNGFVLE